MTNFRVASSSHVGAVRTSNEDGGLASSRVLAVADGMGGHAAGEVASSLAIGAIEERLSELPEFVAETTDWLVETVNLGHERIGDSIAAFPEQRGMGTTLSVLISTEDQLVVGHIGDSRIYRLAKGELTQITTDHTYVQQLVESGELLPEQAARHPRRNLLMRALDGVHDSPIDVQQLELTEGDRYLLCSDGLTTVLSDAVIAELMALPDLTLAVSQMIEYSLAAGAPDNVTVILGEVEADAEEFTTLLIGSAETELAPVEEPKPRSKKWLWLFPLAIFVAVIASTAWWLSTQWYLGVFGDKVAVYQGVPQTIGPIELSKVIEITDVELALLDSATQLRLGTGIIVEDQADATVTLDNLIATQSCADTGCETA